MGLAAVWLVFSTSCAQPAEVQTPAPTPEQESALKLPEPQYDSDVSVEQSLLSRRSIRSYTGEAVTLQEVSATAVGGTGYHRPQRL